MGSFSSVEFPIDRVASSFHEDHVFTE